VQWSGETAKDEYGTQEKKAELHFDSAPFRYRFRTWVTLQVQEIGNTFGLLLAE
jgi:hypothetical protein